MARIDLTDGRGDALEHGGEFGALEVLKDLGGRRLLQAGSRIVPERRRKIENLERTLNAVGPMPTLARGYSIITDAESGKALGSVKDAKPDQAVVTHLHDGEIHSTVNKTTSKTLGAK